MSRGDQTACRAVGKSAKGQVSAGGALVHCGSSSCGFGASVCLSMEDMRSCFSLVLCMNKVPIFNLFLIGEQSWKEFGFQESLIMVEVQGTKRNIFFFFHHLSERRIKSNSDLGRRNHGSLKYLSGFNRLMPLHICKGCFNAWSFKAL